MAHIIAHAMPVVKPGSPVQWGSAGKALHMPTRDSVDQATRARLVGHLRALMAEHELNISEAARKIGVGQGTVSAILGGTRPLGFDFFIKMHRVFRVSANYLLDEDPAPAKSQAAGRLDKRLK